MTPRPDAYRLKNLPWYGKLASSAALLFGLCLFWSGWVVSIVAVDWALSLTTILGWGSRLMALDERLHWALFAAHVASLALILPLTYRLFSRTPLPRLTRRSLFGVTLLLSALDVACWALVSVLDVAQALLGTIVLLVTLCLGSLVTYLLGSMWLRRRWSNPPETPVRVVVVGGGFAGLYAAMGLDKRLGYHRRLEITVIDRKNYFLFPPLLPSVSVGAIETRQVTYPFRRLFEATNVRFKKETVVSIDSQTRSIRSRVDVDQDDQSGQLHVRYDDTPYDYLVLSPGSTTNTFRTEGVENAFFMRELSDAVALRNHIIDCFETAAREADQRLVAEMLRFVIVGAGPTGVEVASEIRDLVDHVLVRQYPEIDVARVEVVVIDTGKRILNGWHAAVAEQAQAQLLRLGVRIQHGGRVAKIGPDWVLLADGTRFDARTCVWCAGVAPSELLARSGLLLDASGRAAVERDCRAKDQEHVFVLGDAAHCLGDDGRPLPPLGQVAFQQGAQAAANLVRLLESRPTKPFKYVNFGQLVSVGHQFAAVQLLGVRLTGFIAWLVWRMLYLSKLVGFGSKLRVTLDWSLDLFIERSTSQIHASRAALDSRAVDPLRESGPSSPGRANAASDGGSGRDASRFLISKPKRLIGVAPAAVASRLCGATRIARNMPDFDDIPDLPPPTQLPYSGPDAERWLRLHGSPPTRAELAQRKRLALAVSVAWLAVQFAAFGVRGDLDRLPVVYLLVLSLGPASAGVLALVLAIRGGKLGLGTKTLLVSGLAVLGPIAFMVSGLLLPIPYEHGEAGDVSYGAYCLNCSLAWALLPIAAAGLSLRGAFAAGAVWRSALLGAGCGLLAAGVFTLHCSVVGKWHLVIAHGGAVLVSAIIGAVCLSWATRC